MDLDQLVSVPRKTQVEAQLFRNLKWVVVQLLKNKQLPFQFYQFLLQMQPVVQCVDGI